MSEQVKEAIVARERESRGEPPPKERKTKAEEKVEEPKAEEPGA